MNENIVEMLRHILTARIDNADTQEEYLIWCSARDIVEYALAENYECLAQFDYLATADDIEEARNNCDDEMGFNPYLGGYDFDC